MLNPKYQRYVDRLRALVDEADSVVRLERQHGPHERSVYISGADKAPLHAWLGKVSNILNAIFGPHSTQVKHFVEVLPSNSLHLVETAHQIYPIVGILKGAMDDLEQGFLTGQEFLVAGDVFDSVLEQAKHLTSTGHKDPAAVLARVVLENALKRIARVEGIADTLKASVLNDELRKANR